MNKEGDLVLVYMDGKPGFFARIEEITADVKPEWFQMKMLVLQVPLMVITWILRVPYINGEEFTMGGNPVRIEKVVAPREELAEELPEEPLGQDEKPEPVSGASERGKVVSLFDRRKK